MVRRNLHRPAVVMDNSSSSDDDDDAPPPLEQRGGVASSSDEESDDDDGPPPALQGGAISNSDDDDDDSDDSADDRLPPLQGRGNVANVSSSDSESDSDSSESDSDSDDDDHLANEALPPLIPRPLMDSSDDSSSDGGGGGNAPRGRGRRGRRPYYNPHDSSSSESESTPPPLLKSRVSDNESSGSEAEQEEEEDQVDPNRPIFAKGDYVVYHLGGGNDHVNNNALLGGEPKWTQGRVIKVEDRKMKKKKKQKKKKKAKSKKEKSKRRRFYHIQPLDAEKGALIEVPDKSPNIIAEDPTEGAVLQFEKEHDVLVFGRDVLELLAFYGDDKAKAEMAKQDPAPIWAEAKIDSVWRFIQDLPPDPYRLSLKIMPDIKFPLGQMVLRAVNEPCRFQKQAEVEFMAQGEWKAGVVLEVHHHFTGPTNAEKSQGKKEIPNYAAYEILVTPLNSKAVDPKGAEIRTAFRDIPCLIRPNNRGTDIGPDDRTLLLQGFEYDAPLSFFRGMTKGRNADRIVLDICPDYWIAQAVKAGAYDALLWLEHDLGVNLDSYVFPQGKPSQNRGQGLLHCLVESPQAPRFFANWARRSHEYYEKRKNKVQEAQIQGLLLKCLSYDTDARAAKADASRALAMKDLNGQTFLHALVERTDIQSLNSILAPSGSCKKHFNGLKLFQKENQHALKEKSSNPDITPAQIDLQATKMWNALPEIEKGEYNQRARRQRLWDLVQIVDEHNEPLVMWKDDEGRTPASLARSLKQFYMAQLLDDFAALCYVHTYSRNVCSGSIVGEVNPPPEYKPIKDVTIGYISEDLQARHAEYGEDHFASLGMACLLAAQAGDKKRVEYLKKWGWQNIVKTKVPVETTADMGEFTWRQHGEVQGDDGRKVLARHTEDLDLVACAAHGPSLLMKGRPDREDATLVEVVIERDYWNYVLGDDTDSNQASWTGKMSDLSTFLKISAATSHLQMKRYKLSLLEDDHHLGKRLEVLRLLVSLNMEAPNVVDLLRWRQCGVIRWLIEAGRLKVNDAAEKNVELSAFLSDNLKERSWLSNNMSLKASLKSLTVGQVMGFLAVEYDDLQSLDFLVKEGNASRLVDPSICVEGWSLLHVCALYGRREIAAYLVRACPGLVHEKRADSRFSDGNYACHIAIEQGDVRLAQFLVNSGCPSLDSQQRSVYWYGSQTRYFDARAWSEKHRKQEEFESAVGSLCSQLFSANVHEPETWDKLKSLISSSRCMSDEEWLKNAFQSPDEPCAGKSYWEIVDRIAETADAVFLMWFHDQCLPSCYYNVESHAPEAHKMRGFWKQRNPSVNDFDPIIVKGGKKGLKEFLDRMKKSTDPETFSSLDDLSGKMVSLRKKKKVGRYAAAPVDPLFRRLEGKIQFRRDTKVVEAFMSKKQELLYQEFVADLVIYSTVLVERFIAEGQGINVLDPSLQSQMFAVDLLKDVYPWHPLNADDNDVWLSSAFFPDGSVNTHFVAPGDDVLEKFVDQHGYVSGPCGLAISKGHFHIVPWVMEKPPINFSEPTRLQLIRLAGFLGRREIVDKLVQDGGDSSKELMGDRFLHAALGAAEAGFTSVKDYFREARVNLDDSSLLSAVLSAAVLGLYSHLGKHQSATETDVAGFSECINWLGSQPECRRFDGVVAAKQSTTDGMSLSHLFSLFKTLDADDISTNQSQIVNICRDLLCGQRATPGDTESLVDLVCSLAREYELDIQTVLGDSIVRGDLSKNVSKGVHRVLGAQQKQLRRWLPFRLLVSGSQEMDLTDGYNNSGLKMAHQAALCDRPDVLSRLAVSYPAMIDETSQSGRTIEAIAKEYSASSVLAWIDQRSAGARITTSLSSLWRRVQAVKDKNAKLAHVQNIQWVWKGHATRKQYRALIEMRLDQRKRYAILWGRLDEELLPKTLDARSSLCGNSWDGLKALRYNLARNLEQLREYGDTFKQLDEAANEAFYDSDEEGTKVEPSGEEKKEDIITTEPLSEQEDGELRSLPVMDNIKLTKQVLAWIRKAEGKYVDFFLRRIEQLASGQRSRILAKGLVGSSTAILETYLEQKSAQRILWTPCVEDGKHCILIWYVARHKEVSRLMQLIDDSQKRSAGSFVSANTLYADQDLAEGTICIDPEEVLLDPLGDTPLKLHQIPRNEIRKLARASWVPPLRLTPEERLCVEKDGTVLLLGRSGTGKTLCIANRIMLERDTHRDKASFKQCFIARSKKICRHVRMLVGDKRERAQDEEADGGQSQREYVSFGELLDHISAAVGEGKAKRAERDHVGFLRYKRELYRETQDSILDPLVIWAQIRTFIKGSIEAAQKRRPLSEEEYMSLGEKQCRLNIEQRKHAYSAFLFYNEQLKENGLWDDCDRCSCLLGQLQTLGSDQLHELQFNRIYVDEIQDYNQVQLALFYTLCRERNLFLAGDNAQSVEEGVDFRFEDLRAVAHSLYQGDKRYIPEKPLKVNRNFRSHTGILDLAAAILERLFSVFPASTHRLPPDRGVFTGPRPGILKDVDENGLKLLLQKNPRLLVLVHDTSVSAMKEAMQCTNPIIGIRDSKGLEFRDIVIVNFFSDLDEEHQKAWRELLRDRDISHIQPGFPQLEGHLKLLYTGITRTSRRLFFLETKPSVAGKAFFRWLAITKKLAEYQDASKMETAMTPDEWRSFGVDMAITAEDNDESPAKALEWLDRAIYSFDQVGDDALLKKARAHRASLLIRKELDENYDDFEVTEDKEQEISDSALACAREGVLTELYRLVTAVQRSGKLNKITQDSLEKDVLAKITDFEP